MAIVLLAAFIAVPVIEIALFIEVGGRIGLWSTVAIVIVTAFAGTTLLRIQGLSVLQGRRKARPATNCRFRGLRRPVLLVAGVLLLTPGFFTDALGFTLFVPLFRELAGRGIWRWLKLHGHVHVGGFGGGFGGGPGGPSPGSRGAGPLIDGDFEEVNTPRTTATDCRQIMTHSFWCKA